MCYRHNQKKITQQFGKKGKEDEDEFRCGLIQYTFESYILVPLVIEKFL